MGKDVNVIGVFQQSQTTKGRALTQHACRAAFIWWKGEKKQTPVKRNPVRSSVRFSFLCTNAQCRNGP